MAQPFQHSEMPFEVGRGWVTFPKRYPAKMILAL